MSVREFKLVNEKGQEYSFMDIKNATMMTNPDGLGISFDGEYERQGYTYTEVSKNISELSINGTLNFLNYDNYRELSQFLFTSEILRFSYTIPYDNGSKTFLKDVSFISLSKTEKEVDGILKCNVSFKHLSLWYEENQKEYSINAESNSMVWDFKWDPRFIDFSKRKLDYVNAGHVPATIDLFINGPVRNPVIELYIDNELIQSIPITTEIQSYQKLHYCSKEHEFVIEKILEDGTKVSLFNLETIQFANNNVLKIPANRASQIKLNADTTIASATLTIFTYYYTI